MTIVEFAAWVFCVGAVLSFIVRPLLIALADWIELRSACRRYVARHDETDEEFRRRVARMLRVSKALEKHR